MSDVFRTPDERFVDLDDYALEPHHVELADELSGLRMHYIDEGHGRAVVLLHGEPTWAYLYRKVVPIVAREARVLAPDLVGFGRSDKVTVPEWYSYDRHTDSIAQFIEALDLRDLVLVVHDWGGPIGLRVAVEHPDRFAGLVILNTGIFRPGARWPTEAFLAWRSFAQRNPDLPVGFVIQTATSTQLSEQVLRGYEAPFPDPRSKAGPAVFPLLVPIDPDDPGAREMAQTREELYRWEKPALVAFSDSDAMFPQAAGERLAQRIPGARGFVPIAGASHFLQEDKGEEIGALIAEFIAKL